MWQTALRRGERVVFAEPHLYLVNGRIVPGVTEVLDDAGLMNSRWWSEAARDRGTRIHAASVAMDRGDEHSAKRLADHEGDWDFVLSYNRWFRAKRPMYVAIERYGCDEQDRVAGTLDRVAYLDGKYAILDLKTGAPEPWHALQTAGYARIVGGAAGPTLARYGLYLNRHGFPAELLPHAVPRDFITFDAAVEIWHARALMSDIRGKRERRAHQALCALERKGTAGDPRHAPARELMESIETRHSRLLRIGERP